MRVRKRYLYSVVLSLGLMGSFALYNIHQKETFTKFWGDNQELKRVPAKEDDRENNTDLHRDFFMPKTFGKMVDYKIIPKVRSNESGEHLKNKFQQIIDSYLSDSIIGSERSSNPFQYGLENNLIEVFIRKVSRSLQAQNISDAHFQIDLEFVPHERRQFNYNSLLKSNELVNHLETGNLSEFMNEKEKNLIELISGNSIPFDGFTYQYLGGVISIRIKVEGSNSDKIMGSVRYRRYFRVNRRSDLDFNLDKNSFKVDYAHFKKMNGFDQPYTTVDIENEFNAENTTPKLTDLKVHFGKLVPSIFADEEESAITTGVMKLNGMMDDINYTAEVERVDWSFKEEKIRKSSSVKVHLHETVDNPGELKTKIKDQLINEYPHLLIENFMFKRFHNEVIGL